MGVFAGEGASLLFGAGWSAAILFGLTGFALLGLIDDIHSLGIRVRLVGQALLAAWLVLAFAANEPAITLEMTPLFLVILIGYVNAFNFMDGVNGISVVTSSVGALWFLAWLLLLNRPEQALFAAAVLGAVVGFAYWNFLGRIFLGDVGSYFLGACLVALAICTWSARAPWFVACAPLVTYVADTVWTLVRRAQRGARIGAPHREHVYQRLTDRGCSHLQSATIVGIATILCCAGALLALDAWGFVPIIWAIVITTYITLPLIKRVPDRRSR